MSSPRPGCPAWAQRGAHRATWNVCGARGRRDDAGDASAASASPKATTPRVQNVGSTPRFAPSRAVGTGTADEGWGTPVVRDMDSPCAIGLTVSPAGPLQSAIERCSTTEPPNAHTERSAEAEMSSAATAEEDRPSSLLARLGQSCPRVSPYIANDRQPRKTAGAPALLVPAVRCIAAAPPSAKRGQLQASHRHTTSHSRCDAC